MIDSNPPKYKYAQYLPVYDEKTHFPAIQPFEFVDRGLVANKQKPNLLSAKNPDLKVSKLTPVIGTEIKGLQLSKLNDLQKDELALLIAERGVVIFRGQDFKDWGIENQKAFGRYFGPLHIHVSSAAVSGSIYNPLSNAKPSSLSERT